MSRAHVVNQMEFLEGRRFRSADLEGSVLKVAGTFQDDRILVQRVSDEVNGDRVEVNINGNAQYFIAAAVHDLRVDGRRGNDSIDINISLRDIRIAGDGGADLIRTFGASAKVYGGSGNDTLEGSHGSETLMGGSGDDLLSGGRSRDFLYGDDGNDTIYGGAGSDVLSGNAGDDSVRGNAGDDRMYGQLGVDQIEGDDGNDLLYAGVDASGTLIGGTGIDGFSDINLAQDYDDQTDLSSVPADLLA
jgi:Ca2+-binding RTX toxin-like protein